MARRTMQEKEEIARQKKREELSRNNPYADRRVEELPIEEFRQKYKLRFGYVLVYPIAGGLHQYIKGNSEEKTFEATKNGIVRFISDGWLFPEAAIVFGDDGKEVVRFAQWHHIEFGCFYSWPSSRKHEQALFKIEEDLRQNPVKSEIDYSI